MRLGDVSKGLKEIWSLQRGAPARVPKEEALLAVRRGSLGLELALLKPLGLLKGWGAKAMLVSTVFSALMMPCYPLFFALYPRIQR